MTEAIGKIQSDPNNYRINFLYYNRARDAMFDAVNELYKKGYENIYIPGYIGWSPKEGSGIFDPLESIDGLKRHYYWMTRELFVDKSSLEARLQDHSILLIVNYFGFRDPAVRELIETAHNRSCVVIEDNAHGFYTYFCNGRVGSDMTFFSLHKMFPFVKGGGLIVDNGNLDGLNDLKEPVDFNPFQYDYNAIARKRVSNHTMLLKIAEGYEPYFEPLRGSEFLENNVPQTFPILIQKGNRNIIYEIMNEAGYGVVSLYHTMIEELRTQDHSDAMWLSQRIMNLPIHQDVSEEHYDEMLAALAKACESTD